MSRALLHMCNLDNFQNGHIVGGHSARNYVQKFNVDFGIGIQSR